MIRPRHLLAPLLLSLATVAPAALTLGASAPPLATDAAVGGKTFRFVLADALARGPVVLYFFPAAFTPGCTVEAHEFAEATQAFAAEGASVIGLAADPIAKLADFSVRECRNKFPVGVATPEVIAAYDVKLPLMARSNRTSYVIAPGGKVIFAYSALDPAGHVQKTLAAVKQWRTSARH